MNHFHLSGLVRAQSRTPDESSASGVQLPTPHAPHVTPSLPDAAHESAHAALEPHPEQEPPLEPKKKRSALHRARISQGLRRRWKLQEHREKVSNSLKGKEAWNKGIGVSDETREKMAEAHAGRKLSKSTRAKMSKSHKGRAHSEETRAKLSELQTGRVFTPDHRAKMAASMRRRHAASAVLKAIENHIDNGPLSLSGAPEGAKAFAAAGGMAASSDASSAGSPSPSGWSSGGGPSGPSGASPLGNAGGLSVRLSGMTGGGSGLKGNKPKIGAVLDQYKTLLREYRSLQEELQPWTAAFVARHGRKPRLGDVEATKVEWLINKYKIYTVVREKILSDTNRLRDTMGGAAPDPSFFGGPARPAPAAGANGGDGAARLMAALNYKAKNGSGRSPAPAQDAAAAAAAEGFEDPPAAPLLPSMHGANERAKKALTAAMEYRKQKAIVSAEQLRFAARAELERRSAAGAGGSARSEVGEPAVAAAGSGSSSALDFQFSLDLKAPAAVPVVVAAPSARPWDSSSSSN